MFWTSKPHLDHGEEALVGGGVSGDGEASRGVPGDDAVHGAPGRSVRLVFVGHGQVSHDHVHPVLVNLSEELKEQRLDDSTLHKAVVNITNKQCFATANSSLSCRAERSISENKEHISHKHCSFLSSLFSFTEEDKHIGCFIGFSLLHHLLAANKSSESFSVVQTTLPRPFADAEPARCVCVWTYCLCGELWSIVIDISDPDDGGGSVGKAVGGIPLHVRGLDDQSVLRDFLESQNRKRHLFCRLKCPAAHCMT